VRHKRRRGEIELGFAGLALLRSYPLGARAELIKEISERLKEEGWADHEVEIDEFDSEAGYELWAETYDGLPNPIFDLEEPVLRAMVDRVPPGLAIDAACGTGRHTAYLLERGHKVVAIDSSGAMLSKARQRAPEADIRSGSLLDLPIADGSADLVLCALALTHFADLGPPVAEMSRIVRRGGHVIVSDIHPVPVTMGAHAFFRAADDSRGMVRNHIHWTSDYMRAFRQSNLMVVDCVEAEVVQATIDKISPSSSTRHWTEQALLGLPFVLIWDLERT
jgi:ubiquinone/menaquinone biosynthesis C-methylase UbiE